MQNWGMAPPLCKLGIRFDHTKGMFCTFLLGLHQRLGLKSEEIWVKTLLFFFCSAPNFGQKIGLNLSEDPFFCSSPNFERKIGLILGGTISDSDLCSSQIFWSSFPPFSKYCVRNCVYSWLFLEEHGLTNDLASLIYHWALIIRI